MRHVGSDVDVGLAVEVDIDEAYRGFVDNQAILVFDGLDFLTIVENGGSGEVIGDFHCKMGIRLRELLQEDKPRLISLHLRGFHLEFCGSHRRLGLVVTSREQAEAKS